MDILTKFIDDVKIDNQDFFDYILEADDEELAEFISVFNNVIQKSYSSEKSGVFSFIASSTLSGFSFPCGEIECKLKCVSSLIRNAILYADTVYIQNPFEKYTNFNNFNEKLKYDLIGDLIILKNIKPLLKEGIFRIAASRTHYCHDCYNRFQETYLKDFKWNLETIEPLIVDYLIENIEFDLFEKNGHTGVLLSGNNDLLQHPMAIHFMEYMPQYFEGLIKKGKYVKLNPIQVKDSGVLEYLLKEIEENLSYQDFYSTYYSSHVLTDREFDINLLKLLNKDVYQQNAKQGEILKNLNHLVPFVDEVPLKNS